MSFRPLPLPADVAGRLWLHAMPGRRESWPDFLTLARAAGLTRIVCLTPWVEVERGAPAYAEAIERHALPCRWQALPMADFGLHDDARAFADGVRALAESLRGGESVLLHCAHGIGRTGTVAACVLKALGADTDAALHTVQRAGSNPQSALQSGWVDAF
ncbi:MAG: tyrosine-protein phosphatase [Inhella sp.]|jgi:protein-tyrosine phosphatase|uniref:protein-tyrosine phosphatase family protein n=1 Tax=Inhella sp. TaxID=1921806 RepID=UPI0022CAA08B|nr:tyrosine-protein phosphatase [Inhella sp.]MCZ8235444.1 tyrosine-protein phosphatase [Inhella sp.]